MILKKLVWGMALTLASAFLFYAISWLSEPAKERIVAERPSMVVVVPLNSHALEAWERLRGDRRLDSPGCAVIAVGRQMPVWIYNWIYVEKGKRAAFSFLDWLADESGGNVDDWLSSKGYPSPGEIRRWNEDSQEKVAAKLGEAEKRALSMDGAFSEQRLQIFGE